MNGMSWMRMNESRKGIRDIGDVKSEGVRREGEEERRGNKRDNSQ